MPDTNITNVGYNGGHVIAEILRRHGVRHIFGMDSPELLYQALDPAVTRAITIRDERSGGFAADAIGRLTGRPSVACGIHGPGALNLLTPLLEAQAASSPLVVIVGDVDTSERERNAFQEADHVPIARPLTKWATRVDRPDRIAETVDRALRIAVSGRPGPVLVAIPNDLLEAPQPPLPPAPAAVEGDDGRVLPSPKSIAAAARVLAGAKRPAILAGNGARIAGAGEHVLALAQHLAAPVAVTAMGRGVIPEDHYLFAGISGALTNGAGGAGQAANEMLREADAILVIGSSLDGALTEGGKVFPPGAPIVHIDIDPNEIGHMHPATVGVVADARTGTQALLSAVREQPARDTGPLREEIAGRWQPVRDFQSKVAASTASPLYAGRVYTELRDLMGPGTIFAADASYSSIWSLSYMQLGKHFDSSVYGRAAGTLGFGFPAAIGARLTYPNKKVVAVCGDGGFGYSWQELETVKREKIAITCIVLNNGVLAYQKHYARELGQARWLDFADVRHDKLAEACGLRGALIDKPEDLGPAVKRAMADDVTWVLDVRVDQESLPPALGSMQEPW